MIALFIFTIVTIALYTDLRWRIVPNELILIGLIFGLAYQSFDGSILDGLYGLGLAFLLTAPFFYIGEGMGAGDVKLFMVLGLFTGPISFLLIFMFTAIVGGVFGVILIILRELSKKRTQIQDIFHRLNLYRKSTEEDKAIVFPYVVAIFIGTILWFFYEDWVLTTFYAGVIL